MTDEQARMDRVTIALGFARIHPQAAALAVALVCGLLLFLVTAVLLIDSPDPGQAIGPRLATLNNYLPGYTVTWMGSALGFAYGTLLGALLGFIGATLWNIIHVLYIVLVVVRANWWHMMAE